MKSALLSKVAMCVCPPAIVATTAVTVPPVRRAIHRATAPKPVHAVAKPRPRRAFTAAYDCTPTAVPMTKLSSADTPAPNDTVPVQRATEAYQVPAPAAGQSATPIALVGTPAFESAGFPLPALVPVVVPTVVTTTETPTALPEVSTWAMTIAGFGAIGWALRRRPAPRATADIA